MTLRELNCAFAMGLACLMTVLFALHVATATPAMAQRADQPVSPQYVEGRHYKKLRWPIGSTYTGILDVTEVFSYGSKPSYQLHEDLYDWHKEKGKDVLFLSVPKVFNAVDVGFAKVYFIAQEFGAEKLLHAAAFRQGTRYGEPLYFKEYARRFFVNNRHSGDEFDRLYSSPEVAKKLDGARFLMGSWGIKDVPAVIVNGNYLVELNEHVPQNEMVAIVDFLIAKERAAAAEDAEA